MPNFKKIAVVDQLSKNLRSNPNIALLGFDKTPHITLEKLRKTIAATGTKLAVVKSSLLEKAIEHTTELETLKEKAFPLKNTTALVHLTGDAAVVLKSILEFTKKEASVFFKVGFLDRVAYDKAGVERLAMLPSRTQLLGKVIGSLKSPVARVDHAIKFPMSYFVNTLKARVIKG